MINFDNISIRRGPKLLIESASFCIHKNQKVAITGRNGCGKSSVLALLQGEFDSDVGTIKMPHDIVIAHVKQEAPKSDISAFDYTLQGDKELLALRQKIAQQDNQEKLPELYEQLEHIDGYTADSRAHTLLRGLGFKNEDATKPVNSFSGGWKVRLNLAQALMCRSDILLLDEPTNHLDLNTVLWLQQWLTRYQGTMLLISHDRDFLDHCVNTIVHIEHQQMKLYTGNYSAFETQRAMQLSQQKSAHEKQQKDIAHMESFIKRFKAKATKAKQAQSRVKSLERMQKIAPVLYDSPFHFKFSSVSHLPHQLFTIKKSNLGYGDTTILENVSLQIVAGDRIALLGANGAGKSTLIKTLADEIPALTGKPKIASDVKIGYFAQHQLDQLHPEHTPLEHMVQQNKTTPSQELRNFLGSFGFVGDKVNETVECFSGGEKSRLALALLAFQRPDILLLDEPTNHLDLDMRSALALALQDFEGALVIISHDSHLLKNVADTLLLVQDQKVSLFEGDLNDYAKMVGQSSDSKKNSLNNTNDNKPNSRQEKALAREKYYPLTKKIRQLESKLDKLNKSKLEIEQQFTDTDLYLDTNKEKLAGLQKEKSEVDDKLETIEMEWLEASEQLEALK